MSMTQQLPPPQGRNPPTAVRRAGRLRPLGGPEVTPIHEAERGIWQRLLKLGRLALGQFLRPAGQRRPGRGARPARRPHLPAPAAVAPPPLRLHLRGVPPAANRLRQPRGTKGRVRAARQPPATACVGLPLPATGLGPGAVCRAGLRPGQRRHRPHTGRNLSASGAGLEHKVERRRRRPAEAGVTTLPHDFAQARFSRLGAESHSHLLT